MKLLFKQRLFSWFDSYDIYNEAGETVYEVRGQFAWGHMLKIFDANGQELATVKQHMLSFMPRFDLYLGQEYLGCVQRQLTPFRPSYDIDFNGWHIEGSFLEWDYTISDADGRPAAVISKELFNWTDTYVIDVENPENALCALMFVLAIDAEKCSRN